MYQNKQTNAREDDQKRLFFGAEIAAPWPPNYPEGRLIEEKGRHITLAFLGNISYSDLQKILPSFPYPSFKIGPVGKGDRLLFLPESSPRVVSLHIQWLNGEDLLKNFQKNLLEWLESHHYPVDKREFLPHASIARAPFDPHAWEETFAQLPLTVNAIHLYESMGNLIYRPLWSHGLHEPFVELPHTADIAFRIQGETLQQLHLHAALALAFKFPPLISYIPSKDLASSLNILISQLNYIIALADAEIGCPFKAVSYHGEISKNSHNLMQWEMIVDV